VSGRGRLGPPATGVSSALKAAREDRLMAHREREPVLTLGLGTVARVDSTNGAIGDR
jgi:hypothetical protein